MKLDKITKTDFTIITRGVILLKRVRGESSFLRTARCLSPVEVKQTVRAVQCLFRLQRARPLFVSLLPQVQTRTLHHPDWTTCVWEDERTASSVRTLDPPLVSNLSLVTVFVRIILSKALSNIAQSPPAIFSLSSRVLKTDCCPQ